ncbi:MAG: site-2 protease family protein [Actinobacteria bacterium]|nr:site-2 protease family protein [Actinomycetota bacterium]
MLTLLGISIFAIGLLLSIALHELGHMAPAKKFGVKVPQYMVGFGPTLWSRIKGETEYGIKAIPLGGYIRMIGMFPPNPKGVQDREHLGRIGLMIESAREEVLSEIAPEDEPRTFYRLSVPKKLTVMFGGPFMNLVIATILFTISLSVIGRPAVTTTVSEVVACVPTSANPNGIASTSGTCEGGVSTPASEIGLAAGDKLLTVNGLEISTWEDLGTALSDQAGNVVDVTYLTSSGETVTKNVEVAALESPVFSDTGDATGEFTTRGFLGVSPGFDLVQSPVSEVPGFMATVTTSSIAALFEFPARVFGLAGDLFTEAPRDPEGPVSVIGIGRISGQIASTEEVPTIYKAGDLITLLASVNLFLFVFNMVPVLPLDGGHIAGALYEGARRQIARLRRKPLPGPVDTAKMLPVAYAMSIVLLAMSAIVILADIIKPMAF